jgi:hypothetical protein
MFVNFGGLAEKYTSGLDNSTAKTTSGDSSVVDKWSDVVYREMSPTLRAFIVPPGAMNAPKMVITNANFQCINVLGIKSQQLSALLEFLKE